MTIGGPQSIAKSCSLNRREYERTDTTQMASHLTSLARVRLEDNGFTVETIQTLVDEDPLSIMNFSMDLAAQSGPVIGLKANLSSTDLRKHLVNLVSQIPLDPRNRSPGAWRSVCLYWIRVFALQNLQWKVMIKRPGILYLVN